MRIKLENISKTYNNNVILDDISFEVNQGSLLSILGESGAGKTTILRIIAGLVSPEKGTLKIGESDVTQLSSGKRDIGYIFQAPLLFPHMSVRENIIFGLEIKKWSKEKIEKRLDELLCLLQIQGLENRMPSQISGGQEQRVAIARALAPEPTVLLMDEPFSSLDPKLREEMGVLIRNIQRETNVTIIFVTHDRSESLALSDTIAVLSDGKIQQIDTPENIYYHPSNLNTAMYMGEGNIIKGEIIDDLFISEIGEFDAKNISANNVNLLFRPHQIKIDIDGDDYTIISSNVVGKSISYIVTKNMTKLIVESFSDTIYADGQKIGLVFPKSNLHFIYI